MKALYEGEVKIRLKIGIGTNLHYEGTSYDLFYTSENTSVFIHFPKFCVAQAQFTNCLTFECSQSSPHNSQL